MKWPYVLDLRNIDNVDTVM